MQRLNVFMNCSHCLAWAAMFVLALDTTSWSQPPQNRPLRKLEHLGRGLAAVRSPEGKVCLSWRLLEDDPPHAGFNIYRSLQGSPATKLNSEPLVEATYYSDSGVGLDQKAIYHVTRVLNGREDARSRPFTVEAGSHAGYLSIPLETPEGYSPNDAAVGDLDGDGEYEIVIKQELHGFDNSQRGVCKGTTKLEAYSLSGRRLWRIDLGPNIREGAHYTPFIVYDLDGDGRAEIAARTAEGTVDGTGVEIGDANHDGHTRYVNAAGYILEGPEFLSIFDGRSGRERARVDYIPRGKVSDWGDAYGNRVDRFLMAVAYLDGVRPSVIMCRGYYTITRLQAWDWNGARLSERWSFDTFKNPKLARYEGQGNHNLAVGDVDSDGRDEIIYGAMALDDDGSPLYSTGLGHGDAIHLSDLDPNRPGLEIFDIHEKPRHPVGAEFRDARTGALIWGKPSPDVGRGIALDIDPRHPGCEFWASGPGLTGLWDVHGNTIAQKKPRSCNFGIWWDGDLLREILDRTTITKWDWTNETETRQLSAAGCAWNNGTKANPCLSADILGDWREEVIFRTSDNRSLRIYITTIPTRSRLTALMLDSTYRTCVAMQNVGYNQPPHPGYFLGQGMKLAPGATAHKR